MNLKDRIVAARLNFKEETGGFRLAVPEVRHFKNPDTFRQAIKESSDCTAMVEVEPKMFQQIDIDGHVEGSGWRLSNAAFGDLCHWTKTPVSFIKRLAQYEETLALEVLESVIKRHFHEGPQKSLVIETKTGRIDGIVGTESFSPISNLDVLDFTLSGSAELTLSNGWLAGPNMRFTATMKNKPAEPRKGDIVHCGINAENAVHGDCSVKISDYAERLVCTNGMVSTEQGNCEHIVHKGDVQFNTQKAVVNSSTRAELMIPFMQRAVAKMMLPDDLKTIKSWLQDPRNGGSPAFYNKIVRKAMREAEKENRVQYEMTLWNWINGITETAHETDSLHRRGELEALGYKTLVKFGAALVN